MSLSAKLSILPIATDCDLTSLDNILNTDKMKSNLTKLNSIASSKGITLDFLLNNIIENYISNYNEPSCVDEEHISNFHFLNDFFDYTDNDYGKDKLVTKKMCESFITKAEKYFSANRNHYNNSNKFLTDDNQRPIINCFFPSEYKDSSYDKVVAVYKCLKRFLDKIDWDNQKIVYSAEW